MSVLTCPSCSSDQTQRLSAIVDSGTSHTHGRSVGSFSGVAAGSGGMAGFGGMTQSVTNSTTRSSLATKLAAPMRKKEVQLYLTGALLILFGFFFFRFSFLLALIMLGGGGTLLYAGYKNGIWNRTRYPGLYSDWSNTFYCHRCQHVYLPTNFATVSGAPVIDAGSSSPSLPAQDTSNRLP